VPPVDLAELLRGGVVLVLDINALQGNEVLRLADAVNRHNLGRSEEGRVRLVVPTLVYAERQAQERIDRISKGEDFQLSRVRGPLRQKGFSPEGDHRIEPFELDHAEAHAARVAERAAEAPDGWNGMKVRACAEALGVEPPKRRRASATVDWFIAAQAICPGRVLVSDDQGEELAGGDLRRVRLAELWGALAGGGG